MNSSLLKHPSAYLPLALSGTVIAVGLIHVATMGFEREADEGTAAHIFQILMPLQIPIIAFFAIKYLPVKPKQALLILVLQILVATAICAPVFLLKW